MGNTQAQPLPSIIELFDKHFEKFWSQRKDTIDNIYRNISSIPSCELIGYEYSHAQCDMIARVETKTSNGPITIIFDNSKLHFPECDFARPNKINTAIPNILGSYVDMISPAAYSATGFSNTMIITAMKGRRFIIIKFICWNRAYNINDGKG